MSATIKVSIRGATRVTVRVRGHRPVLKKHAKPGC